MKICQLCKENPATKIGHFEEHNNVMPEIYSKPGKRELATKVKQEASRLIPGEIDVCDWCHTALHGKQCIEGQREAFSR